MTRLLQIVIMAVLCAACSDPAHAEDKFSPEDIQFRRQAVRRMIFDPSQDIPLAGLRPAKVVGLDDMHPPVGEQIGKPHLSVEQGRLRIAAGDLDVVSTRWVGGFNPFATYDVAMHKFNGSGEVGLMFRDTDADNRVTATLVVEGGMFTAIRSVLISDGREVDRQEFPLPKKLVGKDPIRLRIQMMAVGANLYVERNDTTTLIGNIDIVQHFDLRRKELMRRFEFCLYSSVEAGQSIYIEEATAALSPGCGQADIRPITYKDGSPYWDDNRLWFTMTVRGRHGGWPMQGVFSLDPSVFDVRFEGLIVFDRDDGLLRNELASHIFYDEDNGTWKGMTVGFSYRGDPQKKEEKYIWAVASKRDPRFGFSSMKAKQLDMPGASEDPCVVYDEEARKWRVLVCAVAKGFPAAMYESDQWDGPYKRIAGPVRVDSTGCMLQKFGDTYYALIGSADRTMYIYSYPDLQQLGELNIYRPPWSEKNNTRVWATVLPLPAGYPSPYMLLTMDRTNFPGMPSPSWTYGAMYLYYGYMK